MLIKRYMASLWYKHAKTDKDNLDRKVGLINSEI